MKFLFNGADRSRGLELVKVGIVVPARNEEKYLERTLSCLLGQTREPDMIVVVDDGSVDRTAEIARNFGAYVVQLENRGFNAVGRPELAEVLNNGVRFLDEVGGFAYVMVVGAEQLLPNNYIEEMVRRVDKDDMIVIASGVVAGEFSRAPRGSGRIYRFEFLRGIGFFPINYGWESYPVAKALATGFKVDVFKDLVTFGQRPTELSARKLYFGGKGLKALGCDPVYVLWECVLKFKSPRGALNILRGYFSMDVKKYSDFNLGVWQRRNLLKRLLAKIGKLFRC